MNRKNVWSLQVAKPTDRALWDSLATHPIQGWAWGEFRASMGLSILRLIAYKNTAPKQVFLITLHPVPHTPWTIGYCGKCPMPERDLLPLMQDFLVPHRVIHVQFEPETDGMHTPVPPPEFIPAHHPLFTPYTFLLDLTKEESNLLAAMHPKTRYNIRVAQKHHVEIIQDNSDKAFGRFLELEKETTKRQGFFAHNDAYKKTMWEIMNKNGVASLWEARFQNETLASWIIFSWKNRIYYPYGSSSRNHREVMAPTLLLWEIAKWGKFQKKTEFDLWGALGPNPDTNDPWYGFHRFKEGFAPSLVHSTFSYDFVLKKTLYRLYTYADTIRWWILGKIR